jgi:hypothetical protein
VSRAAAAIALASTAALALVVTYLALGGGSYHATPVADPCTRRGWSSPHGVAETLQQVALSTADGAGCALGVSREDVVLALAGGGDLHRFATAHHLSSSQVDDAIRTGLRRAVDDGERAGAIGGTLAGALRFAADYLPIGVVLAALRGASGLLGG